MREIWTFITETKMKKDKGHERDRDLYYWNTEEEGRLGSGALPGSGRCISQSGSICL